ncbi:HNH endonuclease [Candidatus Pacearchaeota archaeon]|nr:HNH endonuclease [Candidatus Pacearchaeota archaeon]
MYKNVASAGGKWILPKKRNAIYRRDEFTCVYCGRGKRDGVLLTIDHLLPQALGGTNRAKNLVTACRSCNAKKGKKSLRQFFSWLRKLGIDTDKISLRIRRTTARKLNGTTCRVKRI